MKVCVYNVSYIVCCASFWLVPLIVVSSKSQPRKNGGKGSVNPSDQVKFHYIKSAYFRSVHADGAIGGRTPQGAIHMAIYSERAAIPREMVHRVNPDGSLGEILQEENVQRKGVVREMDVDIFMSVTIAKSIRDWLDKQIKAIESNG